MERETVRTYEDLNCYKLCKSLRNRIRQITSTFNPNEKFRLTDQMIRCSRSVTNNIAEGYGRFHFKENAQFCRQSRGSLYELLDHVSIAFEEELINETECLNLENEIKNCIRVLNGYIKYLTTAKY